MRNKPKPTTYGFSLVLFGVPPLSQAKVDALYEAGCDDATIVERDGCVYLDFARAGRSFKSAVVSAVIDVVQAGIGVCSWRVENIDSPLTERDAEELAALNCVFTEPQLAREVLLALNGQGRSRAEILADVEQENPLTASRAPRRPRRTRTRKV